MSDVLFFAVLLAVGVLSGATAAIIGFGIGSLLTPFLLARLEPHLAIAVVALPHLVATAIRYVHHRQWVNRTVLLRFGVPSAVGGLLGAVLQGTFHSAGLVAVLAILLILTGHRQFDAGFRWLAARVACRRSPRSSLGHFRRPGRQSGRPSCRGADGFLAGAESVHGDRHRRSAFDRCGPNTDLSGARGRSPRGARCPDCRRHGRMRRRHDSRRARILPDSGGPL